MTIDRMSEPVNDGVRVLCQRCAKSEADTVVDMVTVKRMNDAIRAAVKAEREACAKVCDAIFEVEANRPPEKRASVDFGAGLIVCAESIRARGAA